MLKKKKKLIVTSYLFFSRTYENESTRKQKMISANVSSYRGHINGRNGSDDNRNSFSIVTV